MLSAVFLRSIYSCLKKKNGGHLNSGNTLVDLTINFFVLCTNVKVYSYIYSLWVELSMNINEGKSQIRFCCGTASCCSVCGQYGTQNNNKASFEKVD